MSKAREAWVQGAVAWGVAAVGALALTACGRALPLPAAPVAAPTQAKAWAPGWWRASAPVGTVLPGQVEGPVTACAALAWAHAAAKQLEPTPAFMRLEGRHIGLKGVPRAKGLWSLRYLGAPQAGGGGIRIVEAQVGAEGQATATVLLEPGFPLGAPCFDAPLPKLDSPMAISRARSLGPSSVGPDGAAKMILCGAYKPGHEPRLAWVLGPATQSASAPALRLDAETGEAL